MNKFDAGAMRQGHGWIGYYRRVHESENRVLRDGRHDIVFASEAEALRAANKALLQYLNCPITGISSMGGKPSVVAKAAAERLFQKGRVIPVERRRAVE